LIIWFFDLVFAGCYLIECKDKFGFLILSEFGFVCFVLLCFAEMDCFTLLAMTSVGGAVECWLLVGGLRECGTHELKKKPCKP